jgi:hypothetical protein
MLGKNLLLKFPPFAITLQEKLRHGEWIALAAEPGFELGEYTAGQAVCWTFLY